MYRYMDQTRDWMDEMNEIVDQHEAAERRLQGLPAEITRQQVTDQLESTPEVIETETKEPEGDDQVEKLTGEEKEVKELDDDEKDKLQRDSKNLVEAFVVSYRH